MAENIPMETGARSPAADGADPAAPRRYLWPILAAILLVLLAAALWLWWSARPPGEGSAEVTFARDMSFHHGQAVEMALILQARTADPELQLFARDMMLTQQAQIGQMQGWLQAWSRPLTGEGAPMGGHGAMMGMATHAEVQLLAELPVADAETKFLQLMIRHHQGGLQMALDALAANPRPEVARLAQSIIDGQQGEVTYMEALLAQRGASAPELPVEESGEHQH